MYCFSFLVNGVTLMREEKHNLKIIFIALPMINYEHLNPERFYM